MNDPYQPGYSGRHGTEPTQPPTYPDVSYTDPAYAGQTPMYGPGYLPPYAYGATGQLPHQPWTHAPPPPGQPPFTGVLAPPAGGQEPAPPEPPKSPRWLWLMAAAAVLLVTGLVVALVVVNESTTRSTTLSPFPETPSTRASTPPPTPTVIPPPTRTHRPPRPTTPVPPPPGTSPTETPPPRAGANDSVVYDVDGEGRAISIIYIDNDGVVQTEFNVPLPWSKEVNLTSSASQTASVSVANIGEDVTCTVTVNGTRVSQRTGSILTVCTPLR